jgi:membrane protein
MRWYELFNLAKEAAADWYNSRTFELGAALAYYGVFAIAPTLVLAIAAGGMLFGEQAARGELVAQLEQTVGPAVALAITDTLRYVHVTQSGWRATLIGLVVLFFGTTGVFAQLQAALNDIWGVQPKPGRGIWDTIRDRLLAFVNVLGAGVLLLVSLIASTTLAAVRAYIPPSSLPGEFYLWEVLNWVLALGLLTLMFAMIYKLLPDVIIPWRDVWVGASMTAVMFSLGNYLIGLYLGQSAVASAYGAAGSLVVVLLWVYYASQVLLFGAVFTRKFTTRYGVPAQPASNAMIVAARPGIRPAGSGRQEGSEQGRPYPTVDGPG